MIAGSVNVNAVTIRQIIGQLRNVGIVQTHAGSGKVTLTRDIEQITLKDIFLAVEDGNLFCRNPSPSQVCPLAKSLTPVIDTAFSQIEKEALLEMEKMTLAQIVNQVKLEN